MPSSRKRNSKESSDNVGFAAENAASLAPFFTLSPNLLGIVDRGLRWLAVNPSLCRALGFSEEELKSGTLINLVHPDEVGSTKAGLDETGTGDRKEARISHCLRCKDGSYRFVDWHIRVDGNRDHFYFSSSAGADALEEGSTSLSRMEWEQTFDSVPDLIAILDNNHRIIRINKAMAERLGVAPEECIGLICFNCVHGMDHAPESCPHSQLLKDGHRHDAEVHEERLGGDFLVSTTPLHDDKGRLMGSVHIARDITRQKKTSEELASVAQFPAQNPYPVLRLERDGTVAFANGPGRKLLMMEGWKENCPAPSHLRKAMEEMLRKGASQFDYTTPDGRVISIAVVQFADKKYTNLYGYDVTERKRAEMALRESNEELARFNRAAVGRELRMIELKKEINLLCVKAGLPPRYDTDFASEES